MPQAVAFLWNPNPIAEVLAALACSVLVPDILTNALLVQTELTPNTVKKTNYHDKGTPQQLQILFLVSFSVVSLSREPWQNPLLPHTFCGAMGSVGDLS